MTLLIVVAVVAAGALYWDSKREKPLVWGRVKDALAKFS